MGCGELDVQWVSISHRPERSIDVKRGTIRKPTFDWQIIYDDIFTWTEGKPMKKDYGDAVDGQSGFFKLSTVMGTL